MLRLSQVTPLLILIVMYLNQQIECQITIERTLDKDVIKGVDCSAVNLNKHSPGNCECPNERPYYYFNKQIKQQPCYNENELETEIGCEFGYQKVKITDSTARFATNQCVIEGITKIDVWNLPNINFSNWSPGLNSILSKYIEISNDSKSLIIKETMPFRGLLIKISLKCKNRPYIDCLAVRADGVQKYPIEVSSIQIPATVTTLPRTTKPVTTTPITKPVTTKPIVKPVTVEPITKPVTTEEIKTIATRKLITNKHEILTIATSATPLDKAGANKSSSNESLIIGIVVTIIILMILIITFIVLIRVWRNRKRENVKHGNGNMCLYEIKPLTETLEEQHYDTLSKHAVSNSKNNLSNHAISSSNNNSNHYSEESSSTIVTEQIPQITKLMQIYHNIVLPINQSDVDKEEKIYDQPEMNNGGSFENQNNNKSQLTEEPSCYSTAITQDDQTLIDDSKTYYSTALSDEQKTLLLNDTDELTYYSTAVGGTNPPQRIVTDEYAQVNKNKNK